jgi:hypothetical protein
MFWQKKKTTITAVTVTHSVTPTSLDSSPQYSSYAEREEASRRALLQFPNYRFGDLLACCNIRMVLPVGHYAKPVEYQYLRLLRTQYAGSYQEQQWRTYIYQPSSFHIEDAHREMRMWQDLFTDERNNYPPYWLPYFHAHERHTIQVWNELEEEQLAMRRQQQSSVQVSFTQVSITDIRRRY